MYLKTKQKTTKCAPKISLKSCNIAEIGGYVFGVIC
jgi:hypothetical protein